VISRRTALSGGGALGIASLASPFAGAALRRSRAELNLTDATVARELARDYAGTLERVAALGYRRFGFRLSGYGGPSADEPTPQDKARMVRAAKMEVGVVRLGVRNADHDLQLRQAVDIGAKIVAMTTAPVFIAGRQLGQTTRAVFDGWLPQLGRLGERAASLGLTLAYHNHWYDFTPLEGDRPFDLMARAIPPQTLSFEVDLAWAWFGGQDPLALVKALGSRVVSMHLKDIDRSRGKTPTEHTVPVGQGEMDYAAILPRLAAITSAPGYVEVDTSPDGIAAAQQAARFITALSRR
jgi:sugar phosphate isomerase/epimerase